MKRLPAIAVAFAVTLATACVSPVPLGDGSLEGVLPGGWSDSTRTGPQVVLRVTDDMVPLPGEIIIRIVESDVAPIGTWDEIGERSVPAPQTRVGDDWQSNTRDVRVYLRQFSDGRTLEAQVDMQLDQGTAERFLNGLRPAGN